MHTHETITGRDYGVRSDFGVHSHGMGAAPSRRAVSPVMRVQPTSMDFDIRVSHTAFDTPKKGLDIAARELPMLSDEKNVTSAVPVPAFVDGTMAVEGDERVKCFGAEGDLCTSSERVPELVDGREKETTATAVDGAGRTTYFTLEDDFALLWEMVPEIVEGKLEKGKEVEPTDCGTALDHRAKLELVVADKVVDERGKRLSNTMGTKSSYHEGGLFFGLLSGWFLCVAAATACAAGATVLLKTNASRKVWIAAAKGHRFPVTGIE